MSFVITDETAVDILIFWLESSDGAISYWEDEAVKDVLSGMDYSMETYRETLVHLGALSTSKLEELIKEAREYARTHFTNEQKQNLIQLLRAISGAVRTGDFEHEKLAELKKELGV